MTDRKTLHQLIEALPESQLAAAEHVLTYLHDEEARQTLKALGQWPRYDTDFYAWTQTQAAALQAKDWAALDSEHLAEEIEELRKTERRGVRSQLRLILSHLLKWVYEPDKRTDSWRSTIANGRVLVQDDLEDSPSLAHDLPELFTWAYPRARRDAADETGLPQATFPQACPWSLDQVLNRHFWPDVPASEGQRG